MNKNTLDNICQSLEIQPDETFFDEKMLLEALKIKISELLAYRPAYLFTLMYRIDVSEKAVRVALSPSGKEEPAEALARLVIDRQKERIAAKKEYKQPPIEGWNEWE